MVDIYDASHSYSWGEVMHDKTSGREAMLQLPPERSYAEALASTYPKFFIQWLGRAYAKARPKLSSSLQTTQLLFKLWKTRPEKIPIPASRVPHLSSNQAHPASNKNPVLPDANDPGASQALEYLCASLGWELAYQATLTSDLLASPSLNPKRRLESLLRAEQEAEDLRQRAYDFNQSPSSTHLDTRRYTDLVEAWLEIGTAVSHQEKELISRSSAQEQAIFWKERFSIIYSHIASQYKGMGAQYEVLVNALCNTILRLEKADVSSSAIPQFSSQGVPLPAPPVLDTKEFVALQTLLTSQVNQLQRYTESQKTEVIKTEVNAAMLRILEIVEHAVAPDYPQLWSSIVMDVKTAISSARGEVLENERDNLLGSGAGFAAASALTPYERDPSLAYALLDD